METISPGEELTLKTRKPYTITKQRERWTEEEHTRFLEALKLYGRAWQRIEEHIGTKTAVQIRSHAQKFFSKLEKEAVGNGTSQGHSLDIDIPPPRPKRKPSYPYPRKSSAGGSTSLCIRVKDSKLLTEASSLFPGKELPDMKTDSPPQRHAGVGSPARDKEALDEEVCSEVITHHQDTSCISIPSANKSSTTSVVLTAPCAVREFVSVGREKGDMVGMDKIGNTRYMDRGISTDLNIESSYHHSLHENVAVEGKTNEPKVPVNLGPISIGEIQADQSYPSHVPAHNVAGSSAACIQSQSPEIYSSSSITYHVGGAHGNPCMLINPSASATTDFSNSSRSSVHQSMPTFPPPFAPVLFNSDIYRSFVNISSNFSSLLMSSLLQNPAAHMGAHLAASFWPQINNGDTPADSSLGSLGGFPLRHSCVHQNLAAIAAATVAAASAWWAAHGLIPIGPPVHPGYNVPPASTTTASPMDIAQVQALNNGGKIKSSIDPALEVQLDPEFSEAIIPQHSASKLPTLSLSDSAESADARSSDTKLKSAGSEKPALVTVPHDLNKSKDSKKVDRSSCGSNTPSSSDVETDALEKHAKDKEEQKEPNAVQQAGETNSRRSRSAININDSWKEVSEEGRLAFHALFSREILPQSFSPPHDLNNPQHINNKIVEGNRNLDQKEREDPLCLDLTFNSCETYPDNPGLEKSDGKKQEDLLSFELGHGTFKARRTGFKPYKRCSVEAKETRSPHGGSKGEEKGPKRIRLDGQASSC